MSVQFNRRIVASVGFEAGACAFEASAYSLAAHLMGSPLGIGGGALFGVVRRLVGRVCQKVLNTENSRVSENTKTIIKTIAFFGSYIAAWKLLAVAGFTSTFKHAAVLSCAQFLTGGAIAFVTQRVALECGWKSPAPRPVY